MAVVRLPTFFPHFNFPLNFSLGSFSKHKFFCLFFKNTILLRITQQNWASLYRGNRPKHFFRISEIEIAVDIILKSFLFSNEMFSSLIGAGMFMQFSACLIYRLTFLTVSSTKAG